MQGEVDVEERVLVEAEDGEELRRVVMIEGAGITLLEHSRGPVTAAAYGAREHTHKMLFERGECAKALGVSEDEAADALSAWFEEEGEALSLSDAMDRFDVTGARYAYLAWSSEGDVVLRQGS